MIEQHVHSEGRQNEQFDQPTQSNRAKFILHALQKHYLLLSFAAVGSSQGLSLLTLLGLRSLRIAQTVKAMHTKHKSYNSPHDSTTQHLPS